MQRHPPGSYRYRSCALPACLRTPPVDGILAETEGCEGRAREELQCGTWTGWARQISPMLDKATLLRRKPGSASTENKSIFLDPESNVYSLSTSNRAGYDGEYRRGTDEEPGDYTIFGAGLRPWPQQHPDRFGYQASILVPGSHRQLCSAMTGSLSASAQRDGTLRRHFLEIGRGR